MCFPFLGASRKTIAQLSKDQENLPSDETEAGAGRGVKTHRTHTITGKMDIEKLLGLYLWTQLKLLYQLLADVNCHV